MNCVQLLDKKRRGGTHTEDEINFLVSGLMDGSIPDYQVSAWLMAVCIHGLDINETTWLTKAYVESGDCLDLSGVDGIVVDKHSTGGVGDKTTLVLIPLLAVAGVKVAKLSGRGLGFTGGTIDKLEAIPNFKTSLANNDFIEQVNRIGVAISGQTGDLAPADGKVYALRDVTATVDNIPLIAASVVSKKIASGADVIVLDIKYGRGAFMKDLNEAKELASVCREVGTRLGKTLYTAITSMEQPLGYSVGHSLEIIEVIDTLKGNGPKDLRDLCLKLGAMALVGAKIESNLDKAEALLATHIDNGDALAKFKELISAQGGDLDALNNFDNLSALPSAKNVEHYKTKQSGFVAGIDSLAIARAAKVLGAGRNRKEDALDLGVGVTLKVKVGDSIKQGDTLVDLHVGDINQTEAMAYLDEAFTFSEQAVNKPELINEIYLDNLATV